MAVNNTSPPVVTGTAKRGFTLSTSNGQWTFDEDYLTYAYQWLRCDAAGANCVNIGGATNASYLLTTSDVGSTIRSQVTATEHTGGSQDPTGTYFFQDFRAGTQNFSAFDTHDANLGTTINDPTFGSTKGCTVVPKPTGEGWTQSNYMCRVIVSQNFPSSSSTGRITFLWEPGAYNNSWEQVGADTWYRLFILFPNGSDSDYPGRIQISSGDGVSSPWHVFQEWHKNDGAGAPGPTSSKMEMAQQAMILKTLGGQMGSTSILWWYETNAVQDENNGVGGSTGPIGGTPIPMQFNHWYDILTHFHWDEDPGDGIVEWFVDGVKRGEGHRSTMPQKGDGTVPGLSWQAGMYRDNAVGGTHGNETVYIGAMIAGPTRASVGA